MMTGGEIGDKRELKKQNSSREERYEISQNVDWSHLRKKVLKGGNYPRRRCFQRIPGRREVKKLKKIRAVRM